MGILLIEIHSQSAKTRKARWRSSLFFKPMYKIQFSLSRNSIEIRWTMARGRIFASSHALKAHKSRLGRAITDRYPYTCIRDPGQLPHATICGAAGVRSRWRLQEAGLLRLFLFDIHSSRTRTFHLATCCRFMPALPHMCVRFNLVSSFCQQAVWIWPMQCLFRSGINLSGRGQTHTEQKENSIELLAF